MTQPEPKTALTDLDNVQLELVADTAPTDGMTDDEAYIFLSRRAEQESITAASVPYADDDDEPTGAMIALVPSQADIDRLVIAGGEPADELHLTLYYLGDAANVDEATQARITATIVDVVQLQPSVRATGFGAALWNPDSDYPAIVLNVGGPDNALEQVRETIEDALGDVWTAWIPEQHCPWVPHICLAYTDDESYVNTALERVGPVTFDRIRIAWAGNVTDVPLYGSSNIIAAGTAEDTVTAPVEPQVAPEPSALGDIAGTPWEGILVVEGIETGDGRMFAEGSLTWDQPPLALRWTPTDIGEHGGAVTSGRIDNIWRDPQNPSTIRGAGVFDDQGVNGAEALRLVRGQFMKGVSVDVDTIKDADVELVYPDSGGDGEQSDEDILMELFSAPELMIFHAGRIRAATQVDIPAFTEAQIWLTDGSMPLATSSPAPSGQGYSAETYVAHNCGDNVNITACAVGINALLSDARLSLDMAQRRAAYDHLSTHLQAAGLTAQPFEPESFSDEVTALIAGLVPTDAEAPPLDWFTDPQLAELTPLTVTADGRIYGHGAEWGSCHTGFNDVCVTPPHEDTHAYFRQGEVLTREGERVAVGQITLGTGHAPTFGIDPRKAVEHYDNTGTVVADIITGNDEHGIWVSGALRPGLASGRVRELRASKLSGDWRRIGGSLRLVAFLAVNVPGFAVPRLKTGVKDGRQLSLVASGIINERSTQQTSHNAALATMRDSLQRRLGRTPAQRAQELRTRILGGR